MNSAATTALGWPISFGLQNTKQKKYIIQGQKISTDTLTPRKEHSDKYFTRKFHEAYLKRNCLFKFDTSIVSMSITSMFLNPQSA